METCRKRKRLLLRLGQFGPVFQGRVQHLKRAQYVRYDELRRVVDRAVDVRLGGEVDDRRRPVLRERPIDRGPVGDVALDEDVVWVAAHRFQRIEVAGVGQGVEIDDLRLASRSTGVPAIVVRTKQLPMKPAPPVTRMVCI